MLGLITHARESMYGEDYMESRVEVQLGRNELMKVN
jgi:hypothetical protein